MTRRWASLTDDPRLHDRCGSALGLLLGTPGRAQQRGEHEAQHGADAEEYEIDQHDYSPKY